MKIDSKQIGFYIFKGKLAGFTYNGIIYPYPNRVHRHDSNTRFLEKRFATYGSLRKQKLGPKGIDYRFEKAQWACFCRFDEMAKKREAWPAHERMWWLVEQQKHFYSRTAKTVGIFTDEKGDVVDRQNWFEKYSRYVLGLINKYLT